MAEEKEQGSTKKEKKQQSSGGAPAWMVTYSDLVTLLLTFFVLLLSMANMDPVRFTAASSSLKDAFGIHKDSASVDFSIPVLPSQPKSQFTPVPTETTRKVYEKIKSQIESLRLQDQVGLQQRDDDSIVLRVNDAILFDPGSARLDPKSYPVLRSIAEIILPLPMDLRIEGHTDDTRMPGPQTANWDLSVERSVAVMRYFAQADLLPLDRMAAVGYGKDRPLLINRDEASRAQNRRVDFILRLRSNRLLPEGRAGGGDMPL